MIFRFGTKDKSQVMLLKFTDVWTITTQSILNDNYFQVRVILPEITIKSFGSITFTIVFFASILFCYHFRVYRNDDLVVFDFSLGIIILISD